MVTHDLWSWYHFKSLYADDYWWRSQAPTAYGFPVIMMNGISNIEESVIKHLYSPTSNNLNTSTVINKNCSNLVNWGRIKGLRVCRIFLAIYIDLLLKIIIGISNYELLYLFKSLNFIPIFPWYHIWCALTAIFAEILQDLKTIYIPTFTEEPPFTLIVFFHFCWF